MSDFGAPGARYEILRTVSEGPRATVFQAMDRIHDKAVALKAYAVGEGDRDQILAEAQILMSIAPHPALPVVRGDFFSEDDRFYVLVINWIDGSGIDELVESEGHLTLDETITIATRVADALEHLHAHQPPVVHGDVKPANILRTIAGGVALVDFDIASAQSTHGRVGTVGFVAPEVAAGDKPTPSSDVYGLAATVVTLLTGAAPEGREPELIGVDLAVRERVAKVIRQGLATDPAKRTTSAGRFVAGLRAATQHQHPSGVLAFLATEVVDAARLWADDADEMHVALTRLRDIRDQVFDEFDGHVVSSMNESDRTLAVFRSATSAALAALRLHDELRDASMPDGFMLRLRAAVAVGEARLAGGSYTGAVIDQLLRLRSAAPPESTLAPESTAELLIGLVGPDVNIVPIVRPVDGVQPAGGEVSAIVRPGSKVADAVLAPPALSWPPPQAPVVDAAPPAIDRWAVANEVALHPVVLGLVTAIGIALIYRIVLAPEIGGMAIASLVVFACASFALVVSVVLFRSEMNSRRAVFDDVTRERAEREEAEKAAHERVARRQRLRAGFAELESVDAERAQRVLSDLGSEYDIALRGLERHHSPLATGVGSRVPNLLGDTYRHGISALSDALKMFESSDSPRNRRLAVELSEIEARLRTPNDDPAERARDELRAESHRKMLDQRRRTTEHGRELVFEAERCTAAIAEAHIEIATVQVNDTQAVVDTVVESLEETIRRVRRIQDEVRHLERRVEGVAND